jgi:kynurenine formamidase
VPRFIDLSHPLADGLPNFPNDPQLSVKVHTTVAQSGYNLSHLALSSHQGTHLDAPFHFYDDGATLDQIPLARFCGPATLVDLVPGGALAASTPLTVDTFAPHAAAFMPGARVLYRTGWDRQFGTPRFFTEFPTLTLDAARWIASRGIGLLGMDTPTPSTDWLECHHILLAKGVEIVIVEGLTNLDRLPPTFRFIGFPLNITGRDGSPIRAVAEID